jgi:hypothetical protein
MTLMTEKYYVTKLTKGCGCWSGVVLATLNSVASHFVSVSARRAVDTEMLRASVQRDGFANLADLGPH